MSRYKKRPCPGCMEEIHMAAGEICIDCRTKLSDYDDLRKIVDSNKRGNYRYGFIDQFSLPYSKSLGKNTDTTIKFRKRILSLVDGLSPIIESDKGNLLGGDYSDGRSASYGWKPNIVFLACKDFDERFRLFSYALKDLLNEAYKDGQEHGQSLIRQLNEGSLSMKEFETNRQGK